MKIPRSVKIFGWNVKVKVTNLLETDKALGKYVYDQKLIYLDKSLSGKDLASTFYHEVLHAIFHRLGFNQSGMSMDAQEIWVDNLADWLSDNVHYKN